VLIVILVLSKVSFLLALGQGCKNKNYFLKEVEGGGLQTTNK
jgi:hypothetical protein